VGELAPLEFFPDLELEDPKLDPRDLDPLPLLTVGALVLVVMGMVENMTTDAVPTQGSILSTGHSTMVASPTAINSSLEPACKYLLVATSLKAKKVNSPAFTSSSSS
jgi:hypothetical protein